MSIASQIIQEAGKRNRSRDWYRSMLMNALQNYQGAENDDPGEFGEVSGPVEVGELYFFNYVATKPERLKYYDQFSYELCVRCLQRWIPWSQSHYLNNKLREGVALSLLNSGDGAVVPRKTIHRYYFSGIQGDIMRIPESEMAEVSLLPTSKFINNDGNDLPAYRVWREK